jgi:hypothetical protein
MRISIVALGAFLTIFLGSTLPIAYGIREVIPDKFIGTWIEKGGDGKVLNELKIEQRKIEWIRQDEARRWL